MTTVSHSPHRHDNHDWDSADYVSHWASGQDPKEKDRQEPFRLIADTIPFDTNRFAFLILVRATAL
jgi:hypothetical protein